MGDGVGRSADDEDAEEAAPLQSGSKPASALPRPLYPRSLALALVLAALAAGGVVAAGVAVVSSRRKVIGSVIDLLQALIGGDDEVRRERIRRLIEGSREGRERVLDPIEEREAEHKEIERPLTKSKGFYIRSLCLRRALRGSEKDHRGDREPCDH